MDKLKLAAKAEMARQRAQMAQQHSLVVAKLRGQPAGTGGETPQPRAAVTPPTGLRQATHGDTTDGGADVSAPAWTLIPVPPSPDPSHGATPTPTATGTATSASSPLCRKGAASSHRATHTTPPSTDC